MNARVAGGLCLLSLFALMFGCGDGKGGQRASATNTGAASTATKTAEAAGGLAPAPNIKGGTWFSKDGQAPDLKDKVYLAEFWSVYCGTCVDSIPRVQELAKKYAAKGLIVVAPSIDSKDDIEKLRHERGVSEYAMLSDAQDTFDAYHVQQFPAAFLVGKDGKIHWSGHHLDSDVEAEIEKLLAQ